MSKTTERTITILPQTGGDTLCLSLRGVILPEDFTELFDNPLRDILEKYGHYNLCVIYEDGFTGWTEEAAALSFKCISEVSPKARKAAYINAPDYRHLLMKMVQPLTSLEVRYFDAGQEDEAMKWIRS